MSPFSDKDPGVVGAFLDSNDVWVELIADGFHVHPAALRVAYTVFGPTSIILVTDSIHAAGTDLTEVEVAPGVIAEIHDGRTWLPPKGILVGSVLTLDGAIRNMNQFTGASISELATMASSNQAKSLNVGSKGTLTEGKDADITIVNHELRVVATVVRGKMAYLLDEARDALRKAERRSR